jgi:bacterioferritin (cytochrome b1)
VRDAEALDNGSRQVLESILAGEEEHAHRLEAQLQVIVAVGEANYLSQQLG